MNQGLNDKFGKHDSFDFFTFTFCCFISQKTVVKNIFLVQAGICLLTLNQTK